MSFQRYDRLVRACAWAAGLFATALMGALLLDVLAGVLFRYVLQQPLEWSEELARFLIIAITFIGAACPLERGRHFQVESLTERLRPRARRLALTAAQLVIGASLLVVVAHGWALTEVTAGEDSPAIGVPYSFTYAMIPIGATLMLLVVLRDLWRMWLEPA